jgi:hypothetical protein
MDIKKLCEEFHEKIGKEKILKITIEDDNVEKLQVGEYLQAEFTLTNNKENESPYMKVRQSDKILHFYDGNFISSTK